jgi:transposase
MESTGIYWKPIYNLLEGSFELLLVNAQHMKQVPGRKTDVRDCEWIADLLRHGLLRGSFVPDRPQRELRELTRYRTTLIRERAAEINRVHKTLEGANIKLGSVASEVFGVSGQRMVQALVEGTTDATQLADLAKGKLRDKLPQLERALAGQVGPHQRFLLARQLAHLASLDELIEQVSAEVERRLRPFQDALDRLDTIPGVGRRTAEALLAEIGADPSRFPSAGHLASWAGMCPGNNQSAGKRKTGKTRKGDRWLRIILIEAAHAASRTRGTYLAAQTTACLRVGERRRPSSRSATRF